MREEFLRAPYVTQYAALAAIRGPDSDTPEAAVLKAVVVTRVRSVVFYEIECRGDYESRPMTLCDLQPLRNLSYGNVPEHFIKHLACAVKNLQEHVVWGGLGGALLWVLRNRG